VVLQGSLLGLAAAHRRGVVHFLPVVAGSIPVSNSMSAKAWISPLVDHGQRTA